MKTFTEWLNQAEYDFQTARVMFENRRHIYCVFMCHLSLEKALKALFAKTLSKVPPKIHSLVYLAQNTGLDFPENIKIFLENLNEISVPTRYPDALKKLVKEFNKKKTAVILEKTCAALKWIKKELKRRRS